MKKKKWLVKLKTVRQASFPILNVAYLSIGRTTGCKQVPVFGRKSDPFDGRIGMVTQETGTALLLHVSLLRAQDEAGKGEGNCSSSRSASCCCQRHTRFAISFSCGQRVKSCGWISAHKMPDDDDVGMEGKGECCVLTSCCCSYNITSQKSVRV